MYVQCTCRCRWQSSGAFWFSLFAIVGTSVMAVKHLFVFPSGCVVPDKEAGLAGPVLSSPTK